MGSLKGVGVDWRQIWNKIEENPSLLCADMPYTAFCIILPHLKEKKKKKTHLKLRFLAMNHKDCVVTFHIILLHLELSLLDS